MVSRCYTILCTRGFEFGDLQSYEKQTSATTTTFNSDPRCFKKLKYCKSRKSWIDDKKVRKPGFMSNVAQIDTYVQLWT